MEPAHALLAPILTQQEIANLAMMAAVNAMILLLALNACLILVEQPLETQTLVFVLLTSAGMQLLDHANQ
jgi:hypothetical protein